MFLSLLTGSGRFWRNSTAAPGEPARSKEGAGNSLWIPRSIGAARDLEKAGTLAPDILVIDHAPGSPWEWYAAEEGGGEAAWAAVGRAGVRRTRDVEGVQCFRDLAELRDRFADLGPASHERIEAFRGTRPIAIPMPYRLALLGGSGRP